jgi:8-oxo-dGTP diphosphatase
MPPTTIDPQDEKNTLCQAAPNLCYTLCFLTRGDQVLLLHRRCAPNQGLWNGVGGRIEPGEEPLASCLREVEEETGFKITAARFGGLLTWEGFETLPGGLYLYTAPAPPGDPVSNDEGELEWKPREWLFTASEVVSNLHVVAPLLLAGAAPAEYHFVYRDGMMKGYEIRLL